MRRSATAALALALAWAHPALWSADRVLLEADWGRKPGQFGFANTRSPGFDSVAPGGPQALAVDPGGRIAVSDTYNDRIFVYTRGKLERTVDSPLVKRPGALAFGPDGGLVVSLASDGSLLALGPDCTARKPGRGGGPFPALQQVEVIGVGSSGDIYCGDIGASSIEAFNSNGKRLRRFSWEGGGLALTPDGILLDLLFQPGMGYAVRARRIVGKDRFAFSIPGAGLRGGKLLGVDRSGNFYARFTKESEPGRLHVVRFNPQGSSVTDLGEIPAVGSPAAVQVLSDGHLVWLDYDAWHAPAGKVRVVQR